MATYFTPWRRGSLARSPANEFGGSLFDLHRQMNSLFDDLVERAPLTQGLSGSTGWPQLEIEHDDDRIQVCAELPGVDEDDIDLTIEDGMLTLSGEKRSERKDEGGYSERSYGRFERRIALPADVEEDACQADFRNGVLTVTLPRSAEKTRGRRIPLGGQKRQGAIEAQNDREERPRQQAAEESDRGEQAEERKPENQQA